MMLASLAYLETVKTSVASHRWRVQGGGAGGNVRARTERVDLHGSPARACFDDGIQVNPDVTSAATVTILPQQAGRVPDHHDPCALARRASAIHTTGVATEADTTRERQHAGGKGGGRHPQQRLISPTPHLPPKGGIWVCELKNTGSCRRPPLGGLKMGGIASLS